MTESFCLEFRYFQDKLVVFFVLNAGILQTRTDQIEQYEN